MAKTVPATKFTELKGLDRISLVVHDELHIVAQLVKTLFSAIIRWLREQNH